MELTQNTEPFISHFRSDMRINLTDLCGFSEMTINLERNMKGLAEIVYGGKLV